jgi:zinc transport system permease protein
MDEFLQRALMGGIGIALIASALGSFLVWRRMAFFGDTLSHAALLGIAVGLFLDIDPAWATLFICGAVALAVAAIQRRQSLPIDTLLGVIAHGSLALGVVAVSLLAPQRGSLESFLFGDLLAVGEQDLQLIYAVGLVAALIAAFSWRGWLALSVDEELAQIEGVQVQRAKLIQLLTMAALIAVAIKVTGVLLVTALLVIPPAAARALARSPEQMAAGGAVLGSLSVAGGIWLSWHYDWPVGPAVVVVACAFFLTTQLAALGRR